MTAALHLPHRATAQEAANALRPNTSDSAASTPALAASLPSESLLQGHKSVEIIHHGTVYRLQATKLGKLILTK